MDITSDCGSRHLTRPEAELVNRARELADMNGAAIRRHTRIQDPAMATATALGESQHLLRELAIIILRRQLGGS
jgi:hypothetical protein